MDCFIDVQLISQSKGVLSYFISTMQAQKTRILVYSKVILRYTFYDWIA